MTLAPCPHTEQEMASACCGAGPHEYSDNHCGKCSEGTGFELVCVACREPMEEPT